MDKRTLIVLGILIVAVTLWSLVANPARQSAPEGQKPATQEAAAPSASPAATANAPLAPASAAGETAVALPPARDITIETPNYTAVLDENGARLKYFKLKNYLKQKVSPDIRDEEMDLVSVTNSADWSLPLTLTDDKAPKLARARFTADQDRLVLSAGQKKQLTMVSQNVPGLLLTRTFTFDADTFYVEQKVTVKNESQTHLDGQLSMRINSAPFSLHSGRYNVMGAYINGSLDTDSPDDAAKTLGGYAGKLTSLDWLGYMDQYFLTALVFPQGGGAPVPSGKAVLQDHGGLALEGAWNVDLAPGAQAAYNFNFYYGPKDQKDLELAGHHLDKAVDLGWFTFLAKPLAYLLRLIYSWVHNYGVAIILVTILIKIVLWPLTAKSYRSMKAMQKLQPKVQKLREKFADDKETMNREVMRLYKTFKVNPFGGCLPLLLQIPFFIAFYRVLDYALELRGAPFMLWITDLSAPDRLGNFAVKIPLMDLPTGIPVLTLLMGASMFWQQKMTPTMGDPTQAKIMLLMPIIFTFILINMPAGLVLYWFVNNILSIGQQKLINRQK